MTDIASAAPGVDPWAGTCPRVPLISGARFLTEVLQDRGARSFTAVAFLCRERRSLALAASLEAVARGGRRVVRLDAGAPDVAPILERFAVAGPPALYLFQAGRLKSIFRAKPGEATVEGWIGYEAGPRPPRPV